MLLLIQSFEAVLDFIASALRLLLVFHGAGRDRDAHHPPRPAAPTGPGATRLRPVIFLSVTAFMMYLVVVDRPLQSLAGFAMMLAGLVVYYASHALSNAPSDISQTVA